MSLLDKLQKPKKEFVISEALKEYRDKTFKEFLSALEDEKKLDWFLELKVGDVIQLKQIKLVANEDVGDEEDYKIKIF